jgi:hypothetical protein
MGWSVVIARKPLIHVTPTPALLWLLAGGVAYSAGGGDLRCHAAGALQSRRLVWIRLGGQHLPLRSRFFTLWLPRGCEAEVCPRATSGLTFFNLKPHRLFSMLPPAAAVYLLTAVVNAQAQGLESATAPATGVALTKRRLL